MEGMTFVLRGDRKLYCFIEVCTVLFPSTPKSTVRNWIKTLEISLQTVEMDERPCFKEKNETLGGSFGLIIEDDVLRLRSYGNTMMLKRDASFMTSSPTKPRKRHHAKENADKYCAQIASSSGSSDENSALESEIGVAKLGKKRQPYRLCMNEAPDQLQADIKDLRDFYLREFHPKRLTPKFSLVTVDKMIERVMCFMHFCKSAKSIAELSLNLFNNVELYSKYLEYLKVSRKLAPSTIIAHIINCISVVKYNYAVNQPNVDPNSQIELQKYHAFQRQLQRESTMISKCKREGLHQSTSVKNFYFAQVLDTLRNLRDKYNETLGLKKMRHLHDFVLLALYVRAMPGRSKEIRTLELFVESERKQLFDYSSVRSGNFIIFEEHESAYIVQFDFKNAKTLGPTKTDLSNDADLMYYLKLYLRARQSLLLGKTHHFFFCNHNGAPFETSSKLAKYIGDIFQREVSIRASTNALRHAIVTYFSSMDEAKNADLRKSIALLMKHSVRYQESVYNDQSYDEQTKRGRDFLRTEIAAGVFGTPDEVVSDLESKERCGDTAENDHELQPNVGDIVALLDPVSTKDNIHIFIAKIARYNREKTHAHLIYLERVKDSKNVYKMKPGKTWCERKDALVFPIDIVYNSSSQFYELRSSPEDIYNVVYGISE